MSYHHSIATRARRARRAPRPALSGWFDDLLAVVSPSTAAADSLLTDPSGNADVVACQQGATGVTAPLDAKIADLAQNWNPTGFYSAADMLAVTRSVQGLLSGAQGMIERVGPTANQSDLANASDELFRHMAQNTTYTQAAGSAGGTPINAPGFKDFVLKAMNSASSAMMVAYVVSCSTPWFVAALALFQSAFDAVWSVAKRVVGIAISAGQAVLTVAEQSVGVVQFVAKYGPWAALAVGGYLVAKEIKRRGRR